MMLLFEAGTVHVWVPIRRADLVTRTQQPLGLFAPYAQKRWRRILLFF